MPILIDEVIAEVDDGPHPAQAGSQASAGTRGVRTEAEVARVLEQLKERRQRLEVD
jgi:hypothetical protein